MARADAPCCCCAGAHRAGCFEAHCLAKKESAWSDEQVHDDRARRHASNSLPERAMREIKLFIAFGCLGYVGVAIFALLIFVR